VPNSALLVQLGVVQANVIEADGAHALNIISSLSQWLLLRNATFWSLKLQNRDEMSMRFSVVDVSINAANVDHNVLFT
jgi:hypothetical protein